LEAELVGTVNIIDYGGTLGAHVAAGKAYAAAGVLLKVKYCASACLMMLAQVPRAQICVFPDAWIGNHSTGWNGGTESAATMVWERGRDWIARGWRECGR